MSGKRLWDELEERARQRLNKSPEWIMYAATIKSPGVADVSLSDGKTGKSVETTVYYGRQVGA